MGAKAVLLADRIVDERERERNSLVCPNAAELGPSERSGGPCRITT